MAEASDVATGVFPETPDTNELRLENRKVGGGNGSGVDPGPGIRRVGLRAEIDTSPPFGSVKEAVIRFEGSGPWIPLYKLGEAHNSIVDFDIKKVEEQAAELEKKLIVKELETLDVLEELGATKKIVEELKQQLQSEALKCETIVSNQEQILQTRSPCSALSLELKQAIMNLGKTINDLGMIQSSVESMNKKIKQERLILERTCEKLASKFAVVSARERDQDEARLNPPSAPAETSCAFDNPLNIFGNFKDDAGQCNRVVETRRSEVSKPLPLYEEDGFSSIKIAEMRWFAAKKMEEAAIAAEAIALAEIKALSGADISSGFALPESQKVTFAFRDRSPLNPIAQIPEESTVKKVIDSEIRTDQTSTSKLSILKKLEEATEEVQLSKQCLAEALNSIEAANRKQHAAEEALRRWIHVDDLKGWQEAMRNSMKCNKFNRTRNCPDSPLPGVTGNDDLKPVLRSKVSMRDVLSRKQVPEEYTTTKEMEEHNTERQKVALSQMLRALRDERAIPSKPEKDGGNQKQFIAHRKKFGFIQISLPSLGKPSKKRT